MLVWEFRLHPFFLRGCDKVQLPGRPVDWTLRMYRLESLCLKRFVELLLWGGDFLRLPF